MRVFVLNKRGKPLMPCSPAKARLLLKEKKAIVVRRTPFTIQLTIATGESKQPVSLGVDAGYKHVGLPHQLKRLNFMHPKSNCGRTSPICSLLVVRYGNPAVTAKRATAHRGSTTASAPSAKAGLHRRLKTESTRICRA